MQSIFKPVKVAVAIPSFSDFIEGRAVFPEIMPIMRGIDEMTDVERKELFTEACGLAYSIAFRVGIIITDDEERNYATRFMEKYTPEKSKARVMESIIAADYSDDGEY